MVTRPQRPAAIAKRAYMSPLPPFLIHYSRAPSDCSPPRLPTHPPTHPPAHPSPSAPPTCRVFQERIEVNCSVVLSLVYVVGGVALYTSHDMQFSPVGMGYMLLNMLSAVLERLLQRKMIAVEPIDVSKGWVAARPPLWALLSHHCMAARPPLWALLSRPPRPSAAARAACFPRERRAPLGEAHGCAVGRRRGPRPRRLRPRRLALALAPPAEARCCPSPLRPPLHRGMMLLNNAVSLLPMGAVLLYFGEHHKWARMRQLTSADLMMLLVSCVNAVGISYAGINAQVRARGARVWRTPRNGRGRRTRGDTPPVRAAVQPAPPVMPVPVPVPVPPFRQRLSHPAAPIPAPAPGRDTCPRRRSWSSPTSTSLW